MEGEYDATQGRPSPESLQLLREHPAEYTDVQNPSEVARPRGMVPANFRQYPAKAEPDKD